MKLRLMKRMMWSHTFILIAVSLIQNAVGQSNYASHANNVDYLGKGLPEEATLDGKVTKLDDLSPIIFLNRTKAALNCAAGSMQIEMKFTEPFFGLAYADFDRNSACQTLGKGELSVRLELPLKGCGTKQEPQRVFTNNIVVRFHPGLEMDGDEIITIVCRYPPPVAPVPVGPPAPLIPVVTGGFAPPLKGAQILFIICAIMFLTLLLLGLGVSYYCLSRRTIPVVRRLPMSIGSGSEITKLSSSTYGQVPAFEGLKAPHIIPRAHAVVGAVPSSSSDDTQLIPSDYPSESQSEVEVDTRSLPASSNGSYDNRAYLHETSIYSEHYTHTEEFQASNAVETMVSRLPIAVKEPSPTFDVQVRVRPAPQPSMSSFSSDTESLGTSIIDRNNLSTIMESHEDRESVITIDSLHRDVARSQFTYVPELHPAPQPETHTTTSVSKLYEKTTEEWTEDYPDSMPPPSRSIPETRSVVSTDTRHDMHSISEMVETSHLYQREPPYQPTIHPDEEVELLPEPPIVAKKPEITSHLVDDVFLRTITEKTTIEDIEKYKRMVTEYKAKPAPNPTWDVTIRNYPAQGKPPQWEDFSDISSAPSAQIEPITYTMPPQTYIDESGDKLTSPELVGNMKPVEIPPEDKAVPNWDVLIRVLENQEPLPSYPVETITDDTSSTHSQAHAQQQHEHILQRQISYDDKVKWRDIITTESTLRTMLTEAVVREDFERIRSDTRYETIFEPQTWDVIIRILAPPDDVELRAPKRNRKKEPWDTRSRRSSLPTLYEYDSDGGSSVRTIPQEMLPTGSSNTYQYPVQSRRTSRSSYNNEHVDMRSMSEVMVDFGRRPESDNVSDVSSFYPNRYYEDDPYDRRSIQRSLSQPSLARSATEITERWGVIPDDMSEDSETQRNSNRLTTFQPRVHRPQHVITETQYVQQSSSTFQATSTTSPPRDWYGDSSK